MTSRRAPFIARPIAVALVASVLGAVVVWGVIAAQPPSGECCAGKHPYVTLYDRPVSSIDAALAAGDGQAFGALAQDPTLQRPAVMASDGEYAYRAQRPVWAYLAWASSLGRPDRLGGVFAGLTILSCAFAAGLAGSLFAARRASAWWGLVVVVAGMESLLEFTPELLALGLTCAGLLFWERGRQVLAVVLLCAAVLTRESSLVAVAGLALWELATPTSAFTSRLRKTAPLAACFVAYASWASFLELRLGEWPWSRSNSRLQLPGVGFVDALDRTLTPTANIGWAALALALCVLAVATARRDVCTWIAVLFLLFGTVMGSNVWLEPASFNRALLPLYVFAAIAVAGGLRARRDRRMPEPPEIAPGHSSGVAPATCEPPRHRDSDLQAIR